LKENVNFSIFSKLNVPIFNLFIFELIHREEELLFRVIFLAYKFNTMIEWKLYFSRDIL